MRKSILIMFFSAMSLCAMADEVAGIVVEKSDGSKMKIALSDLLSIKFADGDMVINGKDNSRTLIAMDDVKLISFTNVSTAISAIAGSDAKLITITDLAGRVVYKGESQSANVPELHGIYIFSVDGKSYKVALK